MWWSENCERRRKDPHAKIDRFASSVEKDIHRHFTKQHKQRQKWHYET
jgi:hypothetical protein